jgi:glycosyltransferase involved in cell wall biosynthesis
VNVRLCLPIEVRPEGGVYTFVGTFIAWLEQTGRAFTQQIDDEYDVLFVNSWVMPADAVRRIKRARAHVRVAHRVDGAATDYGGNPASDRVQARVNMYADVTIFQSRYSRFSTREKFHVVAQDGPIIYNPVDVTRFTPDGPRRELPAGNPIVACASWSVNPRKGGPLLDELVRRLPNVTFVLCGRFDSVASRRNVVRLGHLGREAMAEALRSCDVFLNLSENDPCPNVVLEALASGLPVLYRDSGGVAELVGDCGVAIDIDTFAPALDEVLSRRGALSAAARVRAVEQFTPDAIFPRYWRAITEARRQPLPGVFDALRLSRAGYPVLPRVRRPDEIVGAIARRAPALWRRLGSRGAPDGIRIGWITYDSFPGRKKRFSQLDSFTRMRVGNVARWIAANGGGLINELYDPHRRYDVVVFQKVMGAPAQTEAEKIRAYGGRVVFDANVNYYEDWGDYFVPGTRPTEEQRRDAVRMTETADWAVADSSYLLSVMKPLNERVTWIPDNVDLSVYAGQRVHAAGGPLRLVWSGVGKKAAHLLEIRDVLAGLPDVQLTIVSDERPECFSTLEAVVPCRLVSFSESRYARTLLQSDVIISPKRLVNAYEMGHTEYKITLGMAVGLPAVASPQPSYREAIGHRGGGVIASSAEEWRAAFERFRDPTERGVCGAAARQTVIERYATPVVAEQYRTVLAGLVRRDAPRAAGA